MFDRNPLKLPERMRVPGLAVGLVERFLSLPRWVFFLGAMAALPVAILPIGGLARYTTSSPAFCLSCHATGETPDRGTRSIVHASFEEVTCVDCHAKTGQVVFEGYVKGFMAEPDRIAQNCIRCHGELTKTNEQEGFERNFGDIRITHKSHLERGATCTNCHSNVAHDLDVPQTNRPRMQSCSTCHAASDTCTKCHTKNVPTAQPPVPVSHGPGESMADGRVYYLRVCAACHGPKGNVLSQVDLSKQEVLAKLGDETIFKAVEQGHGTMPAFGLAHGGQFNGEKIRSIIGYLNSEAVGSTVPDGKALYDRTCVVCHGESGDKVAGVQHSAASFWSSRTDAELVRVITHGVGAMPALSKAEGGPLTSQEVRAILDYLEKKAGVSKRPIASTGPDAEPIYQQHCVGCHGVNGRQVPTANLGNKEFVASLTDQKMVTSIAEGKGGMPGYGQAKGGKLTDQELTALVGFVRKLAGLGAVTTVSPELIGEGKTLYAANCAGCHGANGNQLPSAKLGTTAFLTQLGEDTFLKSTAEGRGGMPAMGKAKGGALSDDQVKAVVAYVKSMAGGQ